MYTIAYTGSHGTGKSTAVYNKALQLKKEYTDKEIGIFLENARFCPLPINKASTIASQLWILGNQITKEIELSKIYDILVCDRTIIDVVAYSYVFGFKTFADNLFEVCRYYMYTYDEIHLKTIEKNDYWFPCGIRDTEDAHYREAVEKKLIELYTKLKDYDAIFKFIME